MQNNGGMNDSTDLQFDKAEYADPASAGAVCVVCKQPIADIYYTAGQQVLCARCYAGVLAHMQGGSKTVRFFSALGLGLLAGIIGGLIWYAIRKATHYEIGLVAVAVGFMVGAAVRKGSAGRGGWVYQTMAMCLTYGCISAQYMPDIFSAIMSDLNAKQTAAATQPGDASAGVNGGSGAQGANQSASQSVPPESEPRPGVGKAILALLLAAVLLFALAAAAPVLMGVQNLIGLLIIGFAVYEAWKLNKRRRIDIAGPFGIGTNGAARPISMPGAMSISNTSGTTR